MCGSTPTHETDSCSAVSAQRRRLERSLTDQYGTYVLGAARSERRSVRRDVRTPPGLVGLHPRFMQHELWECGQGRSTFCLAEQLGDDARALLGPEARLVWQVEAGSHFDAMAKYDEHMEWGEYTTDFPAVDRETYRSRGWE